MEGWDVFFDFTGLNWVCFTAMTCSMLLNWECFFSLAADDIRRRCARLFQSVPEQVQV